MIPPIAPTYLRFGTPAPPTIPLRARGGTVSYNIYLVKLQNRYAPLIRQGNEIIDKISEHLTSSILRGGSSSAASSCKEIRGREPIPLTPDILLMLDRLEPDKGKQARLLTEHLTGQRTLPGTEQELQKLMERKAEKDIKRHHVA